MRTAVATIGLLAALLLTAPGVGAHLAEVSVEPHPTGGGQDPWCLPACEVSTTSVGNAPPVTVVESGARVTWTLLEGTYHTATSDDATLDKVALMAGEPTDIGEACLHAELFGSATVELRLHEGQLEVLHLDRVDPVWQVCEEAIGLSDGSMLLSYHCNVHERFQNSAIIVTPTA